MHNIIYKGQKGSIIKNTYEYTYDSNNQLAGISIPGQGYITYNAYTWNMPERKGVRSTPLTKNKE